MAFNAEFAGRPLSQIFKHAAMLSAESGRPPSEEIAQLAAKYPEAVIKTFDLTPQELTDYERINRHAIQMLCRDLSILFNAPSEESKVSKKHASILKRNSRNPGQFKSSNDSQPVKRVRINEAAEEQSDKTTSLSQLFLDNNKEQWWPEKLNQRDLVKIMPELGEDKLPSMIPYPPPAFFAFPTMP